MLFEQKTMCMKKCLIFGIFAVGVLFMAGNVYGQSLSDILKSSTVDKAVTGLTGGKSLTVDHLAGKWVYTHPAVELKGDNALKNVAGSVATAELEKKLKDICAKAGIVEGAFDYTFNKDNTFSNSLKGRTLKGTFTINAEAKTVEFHYAKVGKFDVMKMTGHVVISNNNISILFEADKLLELVSKISSIADNITLKTIGTLAKQYNGMMLGFALKK